MHWKKWAVYEVLAFPFLVYDIYPLSHARFWIGLALIFFFAYAYAQRLIGQIKTHKEGGEL